MIDNDLLEAPPEVHYGQPRSREAEEAVLGAVLINPAVYDDLSPFLKHDDFSIDRLRWIWEAFDRLNKAHTPIDILTVSDELERKKHLAEVGGAAYLTALLNQVPTTLNAVAYGRIVAEHASRKRQRDEYDKQVADLGKKIARLDDYSIPFEDPKAPVEKFEWSAAELLSAEFPDPTGPIPGLIPTGATILGGRPKKGKSLFLGALAAAASMGGRFMGRDIEKRKVLLYSLEDRPKSLQTRMQKWGLTPDATLTVRRKITPLHLGGLAEIERAFSEGYGLIGIDTIVRAMPGLDLVKDSRTFDDILARIREAAIRAEASEIAVMHIRKPNGMTAFSPVDDILGGTGLTTAADCVIGLYTEQGKAGARLIGEPRESEPFDWKMHIDQETLCWQPDGETDQVKMSDEREAILDVLTDLGKAQITTIAKTLGADYGNTHRKIQSLWTAGHIRKEPIEGKDYYYIPSKDKENNEVHT